MPQGCAGDLVALTAAGLTEKILAKRVAGVDRGLHCLDGVEWDGGPVQIAKAVGMRQMPNGALTL